MLNMWGRRGHCEEGIPQSKGAMPERHGSKSGFLPSQSVRICASTASPCGGQDQVGGRPISGFGADRSGVAKGFFNR